MNPMHPQQLSTDDANQHKVHPVPDGVLYENRTTRYNNAVTNDRLGICVSNPHTTTQRDGGLPFTLSAQAYFIAANHGTGWAPPPLGWNRWQNGAVIWADQLLSVCAAEAEGIGLPNKPDIKRDINYTWDCCCQCDGHLTLTVDPASDADKNITFTRCDQPDCSRACNRR